MEIKHHQFTSIITHQSCIITLIKTPKRNINMKFNININFFALFRKITPAILPVLWRIRRITSRSVSVRTTCELALFFRAASREMCHGKPWSPHGKNMVIWLRIKWCVLVYHWLSHIFEVLTILQDMHVLFHACGHGTWWIHGNFPAHFCHRSTRCLQPPTGLALVFVILDGAPGIRIVLTTQLNGWNLFQEGKEINNKWYWYKWVWPIINV